MEKKTVILEQKLLICLAYLCVLSKVVLYFVHHIIRKFQYSFLPVQCSSSDIHKVLIFTVLWFYWLLFEKCVSHLFLSFFSHRDKALDKFLQVKSFPQSSGKHLPSSLTIIMNVKVSLPEEPFPSFITFKLSCL